MDSIIVIALVVVAVIVAHIALYRWVRFKISEGVVLRYLREAKPGDNSSGHHCVQDIAVHTGLPVSRVAAICSASAEIHPEPGAGDCWRVES